MKVIVGKVKGLYRELVKVKKEVEQEFRKMDEFNQNVIEEDCDFSRKDPAESI